MRLFWSIIGGAGGAGLFWIIAVMAWRKWRDFGAAAYVGLMAAVMTIGFALIIYMRA